MHPALDSKRRRRHHARVAAGVVVANLSIEFVLQALAGHANGWRFAFLAVEVPLLMSVLTLHYRRVERRAGAVRILLSSVLLSMLIGAVSAISFFGIFVGRYGVDVGLPLPMTPSRVLVAGLVTGVSECAVWALGFLYPVTAASARERLHEAESLRHEARELRAEAELSRVRSRLEPHFLLNTLNTIAGLVTQRPKDARRLLGCLGDLLRDALVESSEMQTVDEELAWLARYAEILELRHAGTLSFAWHIEDAARSALMPRLLLQPLVENAVHHGALRHAEAGLVVVRASVAVSPDGDRRVVCCIEDNGPGMPAAPPRLGAFGLRSVRRRLEIEVVGSSFDVSSRPGSTRVVVAFPHTMREPMRANEATQ